MSEIKIPNLGICCPRHNSIVWFWFHTITRHNIVSERKEKTVFSETVFTVNPSVTTDPDGRVSSSYLHSRPEGPDMPVHPPSWPHHYNLTTFGKKNPEWFWLKDKMENSFLKVFPTIRKWPALFIYCNTECTWSHATTAEPLKILWHNSLISLKWIHVSLAFFVFPVPPTFFP